MHQFAIHMACLGCQYGQERNEKKRNQIPNKKTGMSPSFQRLPWQPGVEELIDMMVLYHPKRKMKLSRKMGEWMTY